jgi:hypothetical protein
LDEITEELYDSTFDTNVKGVLFTVEIAPSAGGRSIDHSECIDRCQQRPTGERRL